MALTKKVNGIEEEFTPEEEDKILTEWDKNLKEQQATEYLILRKSEYPTIEQQLEIIRKEGVEVLNQTIEAIDLKYPKPIKGEEVKP